MSREPKRQRQNRLHPGADDHDDELANPILGRVGLVHVAGEWDDGERSGLHDLWVNFDADHAHIAIDGLMLARYRPGC